MKRVLILTVFAVVVTITSAGSMTAQSVAGEWEASMNTPGGVRPFKLIFKVNGEKLTGTVKRNDGELPLEGTIKGKDISFAYTIQYNGHDLPLSLTGKVDGDSIKGNVSFGGQADDEWSARRAAAPAKPKTE